MPGPPQSLAVYVATPTPGYNWSGLYAGFNIGYGFGSSDWSAQAGLSGSFGTSGFLASADVGFNFQSGGLVLGVEGDVDWQLLTGTSNSSVCTGFAATAASKTAAGLACQTRSDWLGTARVRVGYAFDQLLVYVTGGGAFGNVQTRLNGLGEQNTVEFGWTAGAGLEYAISNMWTARLEYLYVDLANASCSNAGPCRFILGTPPNAPVNASVKFTESLVRLGINYKFPPP
jgi:outer membrane immunogenic protein